MKVGDRVNYSFKHTQGLVKGIDGVIVKIHYGIFFPDTAEVEVKRPWGKETQTIALKDLIKREE